MSKNYNTVCPRPESCDAPRALMSVTPNLFGIRQNWGEYTHLTIASRGKLYDKKAQGIREIKAKYMLKVLAFCVDCLIKVTVVTKSCLTLLCPHGL